MADIEHSRHSRRTVLTGVAAMLAAGVLTVPGRASAEGSVAAIRSAAVLGDELVALTADGAPESPYRIRRLLVDSEHRVSLGERLPVSLPPGFHPHSLAARGETLWITGAVDEPVETTEDQGETEARRARPALLRVDGDRPVFAELPVPAQIRSGTATSLALPGERGLAVAVEGSSNAELAMITRSHIAFTSDEGRTWSHGPIAEGLGEGYGTVLAAPGERLLAVTADGDGTQTSYAGSGAALEVVATEPGAGRPMAAVPTDDGGVSVFSDSDGRVRESRFGEHGRVSESPGAECGCAGEVVAVHGRFGAWLEIEADTARAQGL